MRHHIFEENDQYRCAILIKESSFQKSGLITAYTYPLSKLGIPQKDIIGFSLAYNEAGKAPTKLIRDYLGSLLKALAALGVETIYCADSAYFKVLTGMKKAEGHLGYVLPCTVYGYEHMNVIMGVNHSSLFYNPANQAGLDRSLKTLADHLGGEYQEIGLDIIKHEAYHDYGDDTWNQLEKLLAYPELTADIEAFSLKHYDAGIGTIGFAWNQHEGEVYRVDYQPTEPYIGEVWCSKDKVFKKRTLHGMQIPNAPMKNLLRRFFEEYEGKIYWHNGAYDVKVLIYELWMEGDITNHVGLIEGLEVMSRHLEDTKLITYLATNSCAGNKLSLKDIAHEFAGNYAQDDITDIRLIPIDTLMRYNLVDCLSTWFAFTKHYPQMVEDNQEELYEGLFKDSLITIIQMELTGMPMQMEEVYKGEMELQAIYDTHGAALLDSPLVKEAIRRIQMKWIDSDYEARREKAKNKDAIFKRSLDVLLEKAPASFPRGFNTNSGQQVGLLLYQICGLPVIETTDGGQPATDDDTLEKLLNHVPNLDQWDDWYQEHITALIEHIRGQLGVSKILGTFIPAFKQAQLGRDGIYYLFGSFNLGGTKSGRLSSSNPNLQNIPSGSQYAKVIKKMFRGNAQWLFSGADFASLEDYISALTTKDPNKLKVYIDGYDGHCLRAYSYFGDQMPDIIPDSVSSINSIAKAYEKLRQASKAPTFALTYGGTYHTLMANCGFSEEMAKRIESNYHVLYAHSDAWVQDKLKEASERGYVEVAFGLRLRTPLLKQVVFGSSSMPYEAAAEGRTAGNALGQSYGLLNCRAANEFMARVRKSKYRYCIKICAQIHDAIYLLIRNELEIIEWANRNLTECMSWQELPEIQHDQVKIHANLDLFHPHWGAAMTLKNPCASMEEILEVAVKHLEGLNG